MTNEQYIHIEDIFDALMLQESEPSHEVLMKWCARYPEHRDALARFFATWAVQSEFPQQVTVDEARVGNLMVSHALNILHHQEVARFADLEPASVPRLSDAIASSGVTEEEFASRCNLDDSIVAKLDRRLIRPASIPRNCIERMGSALGHTAAAIVTMVAGDPIRLRNYKARGRPELKVEDFLDAVDASDLSEEAKREWVQAVAAKNKTQRT